MVEQGSSWPGHFTTSTVTLSAMPKRKPLSQIILRSVINNSVVFMKIMV